MNMLYGKVLPKDKIMVAKVCEICGTAFNARLNSVRTCSTRCRNTLISREKSLRFQETKSCVVCGKEFHVGAVDAIKQTCSKECQHKLTASKRRDRLTRICKTCGNEFELKKSEVKNGGGSYCSKECQANRNHRLTERECVHCGKLFTSPPSQMHVKTCSPECGYNHNSGANHYRYLGASERIVLDEGTVKRKATKWYSSMKNAEYRSSLMRATPAWANIDKIKAIYAEAELMNEVVHVDHIVPLNGKTVSGLHNEFNLQILPWRENIQKGNRHWPDMP